MNEVFGEYEIDKLRVDIKTLIDISRMLENDGRFKVLPSILMGIAEDFQNAIDSKGVDICEKV